MADLSAGAIRSLAARATDAERALDASGKGLTRFPTAVLHLLATMVGPKGSASALEAVSELRVSHNALTHLLTPAHLQPHGGDDGIDGDEDVWAQLSACRLIDASKNKLTALPDVLRLMLSLRELHLGGNRLDAARLDALLMPEGPAAIADPFLAKLQLVDVSENQLVLLPACLLRAPALHTLALARNRLKTLADDSLHIGGWNVRTPALTCLDLSSNKLTDLGEMPHTLAAGGAPELARLNLEGNELRAIPHALGSVRSLTTLLIAGNPQRAIRHDVIEKGSSAVLAALRDMAPADGGTDAFPGAGAGAPPPARSAARLGDFPLGARAGPRIAATVTRDSGDSNAASFRSNASAASVQSRVENGVDEHAAERAELARRVRELQDEIGRDGIGGRAMSNAKRFQMKKEIAKLTAQLNNLGR